MMSGRYPIKAVEHFIILLKTLKANSNVNGVEEPIIVEAVPNKASRPFGRMGAIKRKRTHVKIRVVEKNKIKKKKHKEKKH
jgi:ribosomal protein L22